MRTRIRHFRGAGRASVATLVGNFVKGNEGPTSTKFVTKIGKKGAWL
jgi:hypothetical protein